jgi:hypothetical protein
LICGGQRVSVAALSALRNASTHRDAGLWHLLVHLLKHAQQLRVRHLRFKRSPTW